MDMDMDGEDEKSEAVAAIATERRHAEKYRAYLKQKELLDSLHRVEELPGGAVALPVLGNLGEMHLQELRERVAPGSTCMLTRIQAPLPSRKARACTPGLKLCQDLRHWLQSRGRAWSAELQADLPRTWQRHGDLLLLSEDCFQAQAWADLGLPELWDTVAAALGVQRLAKRGRVAPDGARTPTVTLLRGDHGWVQHVDNGIRYTFDVTRCMFSFGNITEKLRMASLSCAGQVLVDLYAGIGYFTLPCLVHAGAAFVHACEWNPHAEAALRRNLELNGVADRCQIHFGDNRQLELSDVADRVILGLIPSSEEGWPVACQVLRQDTGGVLHIHQNVESFPGNTPQLPGKDETEKVQPWLSSRETATNQWENGDSRDSRRKMRLAATKPEWQRWAQLAETRIAGFLQQLHGKPWRTRILHIQPVKSYAPHVDHIVLDLECRPCPLVG